MTKVLYRYTCELKITLRLELLINECDGDVCNLSIDLSEYLACLRQGTSRESDRDENLVS
jgi:hypothetical protein